MLCCQFNILNWQTLRSSEKILENQLIDEKARKLPSAKASRISQFMTLLRKQTRPSVHTMTTLLISMKNFIVVTKQKPTHIIRKFQNEQWKNWSIPQYDAKAPENLRWLERSVVGYARNAEAIPNLFYHIVEGYNLCRMLGQWVATERFVWLRNPFSRT